MYGQAPAETSHASAAGTAKRATLAASTTAVAASVSRARASTRFQAACAHAAPSASASAPAGNLDGLVALAGAVEVDGGDPDQGPRYRLDGGEDVGVVLPRHGEPVDREPEEQRAEHGAEERAHDPRPEAVRHEDREVPDREAHHDPDERAHQRGLPWRRLRGFFGVGWLGAPESPSPCGGGGDPWPAARAPGARPPAGRPAAAAAGRLGAGSSMPRLATMSSKSRRDTCDGS